MMDDETKAAMAYLDEARPEAEKHDYDTAHKWLKSDDREARGLRAALGAIGYGFSAPHGPIDGQAGEAD